jgi:hypothetical protein
MNEIEHEKQVEKELAKIRKLCERISLEENLEPNQCVPIALKRAADDLETARKLLKARNDYYRKENAGD